MGQEVKNPLRAQSKYGLNMDPVQKQENFLSEGHRSKRHKSAFGIGHPNLHIKSSLYVCKRVQGSQIFKQN